jgi:DNA-directed RNA polymerase II subunit RPB3
LHFDLNMNPAVSNYSEEGDLYKFTLSGVNVSLANAIRRTILSDIPIVAIYTENNDKTQCDIKINTTRLHNEILKHRLSCIPIHMKELDVLPGKYSLELDLQNETDNMILVTTEHFRIKNKSNDNYLTKDEMRKIFPPHPKINTYIDFARLRPRIGDSIPGEHLKLTAEFSIRTAKDNSMYNVVCKCAYGNTVDAEKAQMAWQDQEDKLKQSEGVTKEDIQFQKENFYALDAQRHFIPDSFDFVLQTIGIYTNVEIMNKACVILQDRLASFIQSLDSDIIPILHSETTMDNCYDIVLENEDYTLGKVLEYLLYEKYYVQEKIFTFCGFKKFHPHNDDSTIRIAYENSTDKHMVAQHLRIVANDARDIFGKIRTFFRS